ncbi:hypothetical protein FHW69_003354 [Luteibacter sp. Sphag1AF]|uniref:hypothetical protein n=1 Tax=Luteibacter sp. Sphag1AF TaxID=2587031 RepID=UPI00179A880B|nr:hypothetical protein [Luteibacter sp. Sphag1AF]MBB3228712.1 hypothetical protein [Luteibacter sp. Sphag1AF]
MIQLSSDAAGHRYDVVRANAASAMSFDYALEDVSANLLPANTFGTVGTVGTFGTACGCAGTAGSAGTAGCSSNCGLATSGG